jgi:hypothetical protein
MFGSVEEKKWGKSSFLYICFLLFTIYCNNLHAKSNPSLTSPLPHFQIVVEDVCDIYKKTENSLPNSKTENSLQTQKLKTQKRTWARIEPGSKSETTWMTWVCRKPHQVKP